MVGTAETSDGGRFALLLAVGQYVDPTLSRLRAPAADAVALRDVLADPEIGGFAVTSVFDEKAQAMRLAVQDFLSDRSPSDVVLVYLSCHGLVDLRRRLYFAARDTLKDRLAASGLEADWLLEQLEDCRARRQVVILDCCFSGAFAQGTKGDNDLGLGERLMGEGRGRVVLTASRGTEYSFEGDALTDSTGQGSVFTSALVRGIVSGDADTDHDGFVSVEDAYSYAFEQVRSVGAQQTPQRWLYGAEGSIVLARRPAAIGSTSHVEPEPVPAPQERRTPRTGDDIPEPAPTHSRWRWGVGAAVAALVVGAVAIGVWALGPGDGGDGGGGDGGGDSAATGQLEVEAPWRLVVRDQMTGEDIGCDVTVTDPRGGEVSLEGLYGDRSFQMHSTGTVTWRANDPGCVVFQQPGAGEVSPTFAHPCCVGDTEGFPAGDTVAVEVIDLNGNPACEVTLHAVSDGRTLDFGTIEKVGGSLTLETFGATPVYIGAHYCGLRISTPG